MLTVRDLMTVNPDTVKPDTPLREVINIMKVEGCRQLPVVDANGKVVGIVTDRDVRLAMNSPIVLHGRWQDEELISTLPHFSSFNTPHINSSAIHTPYCVFFFWVVSIYSNRIIFIYDH